jgi:tetratricopeptide (TPR) repeat protein
MANYEKAFTLSMLHKYSETVEICEKLNRLYPFEPQLKNVYVTWGSALDYMEMPEESIRVYNKGLDEFPDFYLLHFNKAITYAKMGEMQKSREAAQEALKRNGMHASSHNLLGSILLRENKIASLLASLTLLAIEPTSQRAIQNLKQVDFILNGNVSKEGNDKINVNIDINLLDSTKSPIDNFTNVELVMGLSAALDLDDKNKSETKPERLSRKIDDMISMMWELKKDGKGFFWEFYVPFLKEMQEKKLLNVYSHIAYASSNEKDITKWLDKNSSDVEKFYVWLKGYKWL